MKLVWSPEARGQLRDILDYIAQDNPEAADRVVARIEDVAGELLEFPYLGHPAPVEGFRVFAVPRLPYLITYRLRGETVEIANVWHGKQDWK